MLDKCIFYVIRIKLLMFLMIFSKNQVQFLIRIRIHTDPDPAKSFGSLRIRIHNTDKICAIPRCAAQRMTMTQRYAT
jgi:hypothetical protein